MKTKLFAMIVAFVLVFSSLTSVFAQPDWTTPLSAPVDLASLPTKLGYPIGYAPPPANNERCLDPEVVYKGSCDYVNGLNTVEIEIAPNSAIASSGDMEVLLVPENNALTNKSRTEIAEALAELDAAKTVGYMLVAPRIPTLLEADPENQVTFDLNIFVNVTNVSYKVRLNCPFSCFVGRYFMMDEQSWTPESVVMLRNLLIYQGIVSQKAQTYRRLQNCTDPNECANENISVFIWDGTLINIGTVGSYTDMVVTANPALMLPAGVPTGTNWLDAQVKLTAYLAS
jgi:hypothetical protein